MKNYQCQTCGEGVLLEPREVEESGPYCMEHLFNEEFPALNQLADEASDTEERPVHPAKSSQVAHTETPNKESVMDKYTRSNTALSDIMLELFGPGVDRIIPAHTTIRADVVRNRLAGRGDWTIWELSALADMLNVTPARLVSSVCAVSDHGKDLGDAAYELMRASQREVAA